MNRSWTSLFFLVVGLLPFLVAGQSQLMGKPAIVDSLYREDQVYLGVTYNVLADAPRGVRARGLSGGIQGGFLRDMPLNKRRNVAVAVGLGMAYDQFSHNLFIGKQPNGDIFFRVLDEHVVYDKNRFAMAMVEMPIELRWRTSTPSDYRFWRIYAGGKISYAYWFKSTFRQEGNKVSLTNIDAFDPIRLTTTLGVGYSTFNFFVSYNLNPFFKDEKTFVSRDIDFKALKFGIMFYVL